MEQNANRSGCTTPPPVEGSQATILHPQDSQQTRFCKFCGAKIPIDAIICTACGRQVEQIQRNEQQPNIIINNTNSNVNTNTVNAGGVGRPKNKWVAFLLCFFLGYLGAHKFYEGKVGKGILYLCTAGIFGIGWLIDTISLLFRPNPYYVSY